MVARVGTSGKRGTKTGHGTGLLVGAETKEGPWSRHGVGTRASVGGERGTKTGYRTGPPVGAGAER
eukprot:5538689-Ditylum_brightwellii.AAC.1